MKALISLLIVAISANVIQAQWVKQAVDTTASLRGLSVVNEKIIWASGTGGTVIRTIDGGKKWDVIQVPDAAKLDFRDIEAFDANTAYILSIGNGESSRIYKTTDGGKTWNLQFKNTNEKAFFDAMACWDRNNCIAMSDPVDGKFVLINTKDGGANWRLMDNDKMPPAKDGEAAFAASGTCIITQGKNSVFFVTGGSAARVFRSNNRGLSWLVADTPIVKGTAGSGIFSIAMKNATSGIVVGGNYEKPEVETATFAFTTDGGKTWSKGDQWFGYRSGVAFFGRSLIVVGPTGSNSMKISHGVWRHEGTDSLNAVMAAGTTRDTVWAVGQNGSVLKLAKRIQ